MSGALQCAVPLHLRFSCSVGKCFAWMVFSLCYPPSWLLEVLLSCFPLPLGWLLRSPFLGSQGGPGEDLSVGGCRLLGSVWAVASWALFWGLGLLFASLLLVSSVLDSCSCVVPCFVGELSLFCSWLVLCSARVVARWLIALACVWFCYAELCFVLWCCPLSVAGLRRVLLF